MSRIIVSPSASGTANFTIASPATNTDRTLTLPDSTGTVVVTSGAQTIEFADGSASAPSITNSGDTNTGMFFPAADTIAFAEGGTEQMRLTDTGLLQFNSGYGSVATAYGCRAWVNFNAVGTVSIRASGNITSITDNGTGDFTLNFTTAMPDANYAATSMTANEDTNGNRGAGGAQIFNAASVATSSLRIFTAFGATAASDGAKNDQPTICVAIFR